MALLVELVALEGPLGDTATSRANVVSQADQIFW